MKQSILANFNLTENDLLGSGGESWVYRLDDKRILRIAKGDASKRWYLETSKKFYDSLPKMDFAVPTIFSIEEHDGSIVSTENRIAGKPLSKILPNLSREDKQKALANYLAAVETLKKVIYPDLPYGEILTKVPVTSPTWSGFLAAHVSKAVRENDLKTDVPNLNGVAADTLALIEKLPNPTKSLVHGDYFPENMMVDDELNVTGIIDFSPMTVVGDPLMDVAGGLLFLEVTEGYTPDNSEILREIIVKKYGAAIDETIKLYRLYYSFYFSGAKDDKNLYRWCVDNLNG